MTTITQLHNTAEGVAFADRARHLALQHAGPACPETQMTGVEALGQTLATTVDDKGNVEFLNARRYVGLPGLAECELLRRFGPKPDESWQNALDRFEEYAMRIWGTGEG